MGYLDELKKLISENFNQIEVKSKNDIDHYTKVTKAIDSAIDENKKLTEANAELSKSYSELVMHTSIGKEPNKEDVIDKVQAPDFNSELDKYLKSLK